MFPGRPLLHECSTVLNRVQQSRAKLAQARVAHYARN